MTVGSCQVIQQTLLWNREKENSSKCWTAILCFGVHFPVTLMQNTCWQSGNNEKSMRNPYPKLVLHVHESGIPFMRKVFSYSDTRNLLQHLYFGQCLRARSSVSLGCLPHTTWQADTHVHTLKCANRNSNPDAPPPFLSVLSLLFSLLPSFPPQACKWKHGHLERMAGRNEDVSDFHSNQWWCSASHSLPSDRSLSLPSSQDPCHSL